MRMYDTSQVLRKVLQNRQGLISFLQNPTGEPRCCDLAFAKNQLKMMLNSLYLHPNGQLPAYEWNFSDVNPPVHAWAVLALYRAERAECGETADRYCATIWGIQLCRHGDITAG